VPSGESTSLTQYFFLKRIWNRDETPGGVEVDFVVVKVKVSAVVEVEVRGAMS